MSFYRCEVSAWIGVQNNNFKTYNNRKFHTSSSEYRQIRRVLQQLYPGGKEVRYAKSIEESIFVTSKYLKKRIPVYSASLGKDELFSNFDLLIPSKNSDSWSIVSVKSQVSFKKENLTELAYQKLVAEKFGLNIEDVLLYTINSDYFYRKKIEVHKIFIKNSLIKKIDGEFQNAIEICNKYFQTIHSKTLPQNLETCKTPIGCSNKDICFPDLKDGNVFDLREGKSLSKELYKSGIIYLKDIPSETELTHKQLVQVQCERTGKEHIKIENIERFCRDITYPLYFLDFETINPAIPLFKKSKPFQHIPTQFSLHVKLSKESPLLHHSFLLRNKKDPRKKILKHLEKLISSTGKIIVYDAVFERRCLNESVELYPEFKDWWEKVSKNIIDISLPFKSFHYYNPIQKGHASLKAVLPALTGLDYNSLVIHNGGEANQEFYKYLTTKMSWLEKKKLRQNMEEYCKMDTYALVEILNSLEKLLI
ncbi:MAG: DUF2779 domain-containing protein [Leptospiraceae bacterium]|nr:DUF2779 domain-containing protein [Leptospiraceae bacterium]